MTEIKALAPAASGAPYSRAIIVNGQVYVSGQIGHNPADPASSSADIREQTAFALNSLKAILEEAGSSMTKVIKVTVFLKDINEWPAMNEVYAKHFQQPYPARSAFQVAALPFDTKVEVECIAVL
ncbi:hypothetical protein BB560_005832 [Smittium megazygosporum]|uniref:Uncharacterized protein n=1 Tax=Smittium megazygosporum TaxID=133381 RepID=A0A2T9YUH9_9FUNG|nr:hypothetical protein BB560_005832 [Smittium megazygosporum]